MLADIIRRRHVVQAGRILAACGLAWLGTWVVGLKEFYWALITALIVAQPGLHRTVAAGRDRIIGTILGAAAGFLILELKRRGLPQLPFFLVALALLAFFAAIWPNMRIASITLIVLVLVPTSGTNLGRPIDRVLEIVIGVIASIAAAALLPAAADEGDTT